MKVANIIGKIIMVFFELSSIKWITIALGLRNEYFFPEDIPVVLGNIALFIVGIIITVSTGRALKKRKNTGKK